MDQTKQNQMNKIVSRQLNRSVYVVGGVRTPFLKARTSGPGPFSASDLAVFAGQGVFRKFKIDPQSIEEVVIGCVSHRENEANIARIVALRLGCGDKVPGYTVQRNCGSGIQSIDSALKDIGDGRYDLVLAGGTEAMSHIPLIFNREFTKWLAQINSQKSLGKKLSALLQFHPRMLNPIIGVLCGLRDPVVDLGMGQTAEELAYRFNISRTEMDEFAVESHLRIAAAQKASHLDEIITIYDDRGNYYDHDDGVRPDSSVEKLAKLKPVFDRFGTITAGNSSQVTDGAAMLLLASDDAIKKYDLPVAGRIIDVNWAALDPKIMGLGPVYSSTPLLLRNQLNFSDIDYWEINEAFAAQVIACLKVWNDPKFCREELGIETAFGELDQSRLNIDGGAIAIGHPVGASGARLVIHLLDVLKRHQAKRGIATLCIGGGQGGAILLEREDD